MFASVFSVTYESWAGKLLVSASATILCVPSQVILEFQATNSGGQIASSMAPMYTTSFQMWREQRNLDGLITRWWDHIEHNGKTRMRAACVSVACPVRIDPTPESVLQFCTAAELSAFFKCAPRVSEDMIGGFHL